MNVAPVFLVVGFVALLLALFGCFRAYLGFCRFVVLETKSTAGLRDVAVAMRAFAVLPLPRVLWFGPSRSK